VLGPLNSLLWYVPSSKYIWSSDPILFLQEQIRDIIIISSSLCDSSATSSRVLGRHLATLGAAYADDTYLMGCIEPTLMALADTVRSFRQDADLEVCLGKCTIYMPGIPEEHSHQLISDCIVTNASGTLGPLLPMLTSNLDVIQVHCLRVVGPSVGTSEYVREYVRIKCGTICKDVETIRICADPLIRYHLLKFCMNTRLSFLSRNVTPDYMATSSTDSSHIGPAHVDQKIVNEVISTATGQETNTAHAELVQVHRPIPAPQMRVRDNSDSSIWFGSILFGYS
jgi:hypothetical protein